MNARVISTLLVPVLSQPAEHCKGLSIAGHSVFFFTSRFACGELVLRLLCIFRVCLYLSLCVCIYHVHNNYITHIVAMLPYFSRLRQFRRLLCVAAMSSLAQLRVRDGY